MGGWRRSGRRKHQRAALGAACWLGGAAGLLGAVLTGCSSGPPAPGATGTSCGTTRTGANVPVRIGEVVRGTVSAISKNGSVEVGIREGSAARLELNTDLGRVYNELTPSDAPEAEEPVAKVEVHASTKLGDVTVRRAPRLDEEA